LELVRLRGALRAVFTARGAAAAFLFFARQFAASVIYRLSLITLEVTQLPRERWHPAGSGSTTRRLDDSTTRRLDDSTELAEV